MKFNDAIGWFGFAIVLFSYAMVATRKWRVRSIANQVGNMAGSVCLSINSFFYEAFVPLALNVIWGLISFVILCRLLNTKEGQPIEEN